MQDDQINKTFGIIRNLPPQVGYESIRQLVLSQPPAIYLHHNHIWFNLKNIIIMTTSASIITALLLFNYSSDTKITAPVKQQKKEIIKKEIVMPQQEKLSMPPPANLTVIAPVKEEKRKSKPVADTVTQPVNSTEQNIADAPISLREPPLIIEPVDAEMPEPPLNLLNACSPHPPYPCNCACNDGNNVTCTFKEKLMDDEIISESDKFSFALDSKSFTVNGKEQPENVFKKYSRIYKELTGKKLNEGSSMTVSVDKGNCSININLND